MKDAVPSAETLKAATRWERHAAWREGFWLGFVFTIEPPQAHLLQARVEAALATLGRRQRVLRPDSPKQLEAVLAEIVAGAEWGCTWVEAVREPDAESGAWTQAWIRLLLRANERRELLRSQLAGGLVFVANPAIKADIRAAAPDLWSVRTLVAELPPGPGLVDPSVSPQAVATVKPGGAVDLELLDEDLGRATVLDGEPPEQQAPALARLAVRLYAAGRYEEASSALQRAVGHYRELAKARPDAFLPDLAMALNNLALYHRKLGRREEVLGPAQEAVAIWRALASANSDAFLHRLAESLDNLGGYMDFLERYDDALITTQEAVEISRKLASSNLDSLPILAAALDNTGIYLHRLGRKEEALSAAQEAVDYFRKLVRTKPDVFLPDLARALVNFGVRLWSLGRMEEALSVTQEGIGHYRTLAAARPRVFLPDLARALGGLGSIQRARGEHQASLSAFSEALRILEPFFRALPAAYDHRFRLLINGLEATCKEGGLTPPPDIQALLDGLTPPSS